MFNVSQQQESAPVVQPTTITAPPPSIDVVDEAPKSQPSQVESSDLVAPPVESVVVERKQSGISTEAVEVVNNSMINGEAPKEPEVVVVIKISYTLVNQSSCDAHKINFT